MTHRDGGSVGVDLLHEFPSAESGLLEAVDTSREAGNTDSLNDELADPRRRKEKFELVSLITPVSRVQQLPLGNIL